MQIYLPIADLPVNVFVILAMGFAVGFISGMFGIGGGFLMTPLLIFLGVSPAVSVATVVEPHRRLVDVRRASAIGDANRSILRSPSCCWPAASSARPSASGCSRCCATLGQLDITIGLSYVLLLEHHRRPDGDRKRARDHAGAGRASRSNCAGPAAIPGSTACRSSCASSDRTSTSRRSRSGPSDSSSASSAPSWASAAAFCWCRC